MDSNFFPWLSLWMYDALHYYGWLAVWAGVFVFGENGAIVAFVQSAQGFIDPKVAFIWASLGSLSADIFWYGAYKLYRQTTVKPRFLRRLEVLSPPRYLASFADRHPLLVFTFIKFLVGMRIILTLYVVSRKQMTFGVYVLLNTIGTLFFMGVLFSIGWSIGHGIYWLLGDFHILGNVMTILVLTLLMTQLIPRFLRVVFPHIWERPNNKKPLLMNNEE